MSSFGDAHDGKGFYVPLPSIDPKAILLTPENFVWGVEHSGMSDAKHHRYLISSESSSDGYPICYTEEDELPYT